MTTTAICLFAAMLTTGLLTGIKKSDRLAFASDRVLRLGTFSMPM